MIRAVPLLLLSLWSTCAPPAREAPPAPSPRQPAQILSFHHADWLERPGRAEEDKPEEVLRAMNLKPGDVVAEIGAGTGFFARRLARAVAPGGRVYANDIQPEMLDLLREYTAKEQISNVVPVLGTETDPQLPAGELDWVLMVDVYHEFARPKPMLEKIRASLKPDGKVALVEYRLEGDSAASIKTEHRMSVEQVLAEWLPAGFELIERRETLPKQHLFLFRVRR
jgi:ubiquinone/menaquinone biosynthesis C-methylase UbiE